MPSPLSMAEVLRAGGGRLHNLEDVLNERLLDSPGRIGTGLENLGETMLDAPPGTLGRVGGTTGAGAATMGGLAYGGGGPDRGPSPDRPRNSMADVLEAFRQGDFPISPYTEAAAGNVAGAVGRHIAEIPQQAFVASENRRTATIPARS